MNDNILMKEKVYGLKQEVRKKNIKDTRENYS